MTNLIITETVYTLTVNREGYVYNLKKQTKDLCPSENKWCDLEVSFSLMIDWTQADMLIISTLDLMMTELFFLRILTN